MDTRKMSGTLKSIEVLDQSRSDTVFSVRKPGRACYGNDYYEYRDDGDYVLRFVDAAYIKGTVTVYFVENVF